MAKKVGKKEDKIKVKVLVKALSQRVDSVTTDSPDQEQIKQEQIDRNTVYKRIIE